MRVNISILPDLSTRNTISRLVWGLHRQYRIGLRAARHPWHVSLKQPFEVEDAALAALETFFDAFTAGTQPFTIHLDELEQQSSPTYPAVLWLAARESAELRALHQQLNSGLQALLGSAPAAFDGPLFRFHMTLALLDDEDMKAADIPRLMRDHARIAPNLAFESYQLAMFISDTDETDRIGFLTYKVKPPG
ncbi:MAG: 2'-5' RNA ligase family protein [Thermoflexales bacterium]